MSFAGKIQQVSHWLNNSREPVIYDGAPALLLIDVQKTYARPGMRYARGTKETKQASQRIAKLTPAFRKLGIPVFAVYFSAPTVIPLFNKWAFQYEIIDFYKYTPQGKDVVVAKTTDGAFESSTLDEQLKAMGIQTLLTCGFNASACVKETVLGALARDYHVELLEDLLANGQGFKTPQARAEIAFERMAEQGALRTNSATVLARLRLEREQQISLRPAA